MIHTQIQRSPVSPIGELKNLLAKLGTLYNFLNEILAHTTTAGILQREFCGRLHCAYAKLNKLAESRKIFDQMPNRGMGSWASLQNLYLNIKQPRKTPMIFSELILSDLAKPDSHSIVSQPKTWNDPPNFMGTARLPLQFISARLFSSFSDLIRRPWIHYKDAPENSNGESAFYKRALKLQRPTTVRYQDNLQNFVSLIGEIVWPLKACNAMEFGVYTLLRLRAPSRAYRDSTIRLVFWGEMAEVSVQHLKPHDLVYVSGRLGSYLKADEDGSSVRYYKVTVEEMNFVAQNSPKLVCQNLVKLEPKYSVEDMMQKRRNRLHLWQIFFASPSEWWDNRNSKLKPGLPDFKHKDTGESLWLKDNDPLWIKQQLQLQDSRLCKRSYVDQSNAWSQLSPLVYDEVKSN
ncbi:hypothetical protein C2S52_012030 [Perilla frutescens var. hirtella]|nr:hypothetical protein C2S52_012030 [Perilla frutescens var. hirtella]KAH6785370.1 hypothetical protein C2S51_037825 [Perilla frutescens var. frutescens]